MATTLNRRYLYIQETHASIKRWQHTSFDVRLGNRVRGSGFKPQSRHNVEPIIVRVDQIC